MITHKACHYGGLDTLIFRTVKNTICRENYYLYIYDYCHKKTSDMSNFYTDDNNETNTWNFNLKYENTTKKSIMEQSKNFKFGDYSYDDNDSKILVKAIGHIYSSDTNGQAHIIEKNIYESSIYDKEKYIGQKILYTTNMYNQELNVFVIRDLNTKKLYFYCILCENDTSININRKKSKCSFKKVDISILGIMEKNLIEYINYIKLDYGRIELILDEIIGWCIVDVNNSPGGGPITNLVYKDIATIFNNIIK